MRLKNNEARERHFSLNPSLILIYFTHKARWRRGNAAVCRTDMQGFDSPPRLNMANPERNIGEKVGITARNGGIIAGIIGLVLSPELLVLGAGVAISGEALKRVSKKD